MKEIRLLKMKGVRSLKIKYRSLWGTHLSTCGTWKTQLYFLCQEDSIGHDLVQVRTENMYHVGTKSKCEYTRCKKALCSGAHVSFVYPWSLAVPVIGELQAPGGRIGAVHCDSPWSASCSTGVMSSTHSSLLTCSLCLRPGSWLTPLCSWGH